MRFSGALTLLRLILNISRGRANKREENNRESLAGLTQDSLMSKCINERYNKPLDKYHAKTRKGLFNPNETIRQIRLIRTVDLT